MPRKGRTACPERASNILYTRQRTYASMIGARPKTLYGLAGSPSAWQSGFSTMVTAGASRWHQSPWPCSGTRATDIPQAISHETTSLATSRPIGRQARRLLRLASTEKISSAFTTLLVSPSRLPLASFRARTIGFHGAGQSRRINLIYFSEADKGSRFAA
jgi:hypothetical protein